MVQAAQLTLALVALLINGVRTFAVAAPGRVEFHLRTAITRARCLETQQPHESVARSRAIQRLGP